MTDLACPKCSGTNTYFDGAMHICPECSHEWVFEESLDGTEAEVSEDQGLVVKDANGTRLADGDSVTVIKDLKVKGANSALKSGTKVKSIKLVESSDGHNISCKIDGFGAMALKSEFVRKA